MGKWKDYAHAVEQDCERMADRAIKAEADAEALREALRESNSAMKQAAIDIEKSKANADTVAMLDAQFVRNRAALSASEGQPLREEQRRRGDLIRYAQTHASEGHGLTEGGDSVPPRTTRGGARSKGRADTALAESEGHGLSEGPEGTTFGNREPVSPSPLAESDPDRKEAE